MPSSKEWFRNAIVKDNDILPARQSAQEIARILVAATALLLIVISIAIHNEALSGLHSWLPGLRITY